MIHALADPGRQTAIAFVLVSLLLMLNFILLFPDFGAIVTQYNKF